MIRRILHDLVNGIWSGIPVCCILFFIKRNNSDTIAQDVSQERGLEWPNDGEQYVRCDKCFQQNHRIKIKLNGCIMGWLYGYRRVPGTKRWRIK